MLEVLHQLEIAWVLAIQTLSIWLAPALTLVSEIGSENFFMFGMPVIYWSFDALLGTQVAILLLLSNASNAGLKLLFHSSRPYWFSPRVHAFAVEPSFGFPSGHAQTAATIWGFLAIRVQDKVMKILLFLLIFVIGFSRVYLGMHFFSDVIGGWLIGALLVWGFLRVERPLVRWLQTQSLRQMFILALISAAIIVAVNLVPAALAQNWPIPAAWLQNALAATQTTALNPYDIHGAFTVSGTWFGFMAGLAFLYHRQGAYCADGTPLQRLLRYLIGLLGIFVFYYALGLVFPREANLVSYALRFLRYTLVGLWVSLLAPLTFQRLGLLQPIKLKVALVKND
jgi:membrane-associated phospholipid phosphatase